MQAFSAFTLWFMLFVNVGRFQEIFPFLIPFQLGKVSLALGLAFICAQNPRDLRTLLFDSPIKKYLLTILFFALFGIPFSVYISGSIESFTSLIRLFFITSIIVALGKKNPESMRLCLITMLLILSVQVIIQKAVGRVSISSTYDPNDIALLCIILLPIALSGLSHKSFIVKICSLIASGGAVASIALSGSRGGLVALIAVTIYAIILAKKRRILLITLCIIGGIIFSAMAGDELWARIQALRDGSDYNFSTTGDSRFAIWSTGLEVMLKKPIFGVGIGQFITGLATVGGGVWRTAHNSFLQIGMELGLGGLWAFCGMLFFIYRLSVKGSQATYLTTAQQNSYMYLRLSFLGFCVGGFFVSHAYSPIAYSLICFSVVMHYNLEDIKKKSLQEDTVLYQNEISPPSGIEKKSSVNRISKVHSQAHARRNIRKSRLETGDLLHKKNTS